MRIKTFTAPTMEEALRLIREQLGSEALILGTRKITGANGKPTLEITAAINEEEPATKPVTIPNLTAAEPQSTAQPSHTGLAGILQSHGVAESLVQKIIAALPGLNSAGFSAAESLEMLLTKLTQFKNPVDVLTPGQAHVFIGPHGAGKTTLISKLAIQHKKQGRSVGLMSLDTQKIAGFEPLAIVAESLGDSAHLLTSIDSLRTAAVAMGPRHVLLIDTPGLNPYHPQSLTALKQQLESFNIPFVIHLVVPASLNGADMSTLPVACHRFNLSSLVVTKIDSTSRYGALFSTAANSGLALSLATHHADVTTPPLTITAQWLAQALSTLPHQPWEFGA